ESMDQRIADADRSAVETRRDMTMGLLRLRENDATVERIAEQVADVDRDRVQLGREQAQLLVLLTQQRHRLDAMEQHAREFAASAVHRLDQLTGDVGRLPPAVPAAPPRSDVPALDYVRFEQRFRGSSEQVLEQQRRYLPLFDGASDVLDIGCGRGEFMELLISRGVTCRGVDLDSGMVAACRERGLDVEYGDALELLRGLPDNSLGGAFSAQVVEHLTPAQLAELTDLLGRKLRPGAPVVMETINPMSLLAASTHFLLDLSHTRLVHPETLKFLLDCAGFVDFELLPSSPVPDDVRLEYLPRFSDAGLRDEWMDAMNRNLERLNGFLYGFQDYALAARRLGGEAAE
ncbi:MAG: class I SAM-dependent methyltransferase, partial [Chloroflexi bacterium]|nr:class I SAM-dependent methyltransferase [Chloroflexota bacterium]